MLRVEALSARGAFLAVDTDDFCPLSAVLFTPIASPAWEGVLGRSDPAGKHHGFVLPGLHAQTTYLAIPFALNGFGLLGFGATFQFTTP
jgi:hypothetical protein